MEGVEKEKERRSRTEKVRAWGSGRERGEKENSGGKKVGEERERGGEGDRGRRETDKKDEGGKRK